MVRRLRKRFGRAAVAWSTAAPSPQNLRVFVFFVVKSPFARPDEGKGVVYHEDHEGELSSDLVYGG